MNVLVLLKLAELVTRELESTREGFVLELGISESVMGEVARGGSVLRLEEFVTREIEVGEESPWAV